LTVEPRHAFGLDLLRALAVACVLVAHGSLFFTASLPGARYLLIVFGVCGVEIFFALSGFLVGRQLLLVARGEVEARAFLLRRWFRTLPNYYLFLAVDAVLAIAVTHGDRPDASYLVFAQSLAAPAHLRFFPESWSLAIEEWFYLLAAILFAFAAWRRVSPRALGLALLATVAAGPLIRIAVQSLATLPIDEGIRKITFLRLDALVFGLGAAWLERYAPRAFEALRGRGPRLASLILTGVAAAVLVRWSRELAFFAPAGTAPDAWVAAILFSVLPLAAALWLPWLSRWIEWRSPLARPVRKVSEWSYALYLTHFPMLLALLTLWPAAPGDAMALMLRTSTWLAASIVLAAFVYRYYEHPLTLRRPPLRRTLPQGG
jgi:peptidoglycan/LPS O-acetylase OafA/YrhL